jgi:hypothetical protein
VWTVHKHQPNTKRWIIIPKSNGGSFSGEGWCPHVTQGNRSAAQARKNIIIIIQLIILSPAVSLEEFMERLQSFLTELRIILFLHAQHL